MSAPDNAITLWDDLVESSHKNLQDKVSCVCGWKGKLGDLLCEPDDEDTNFWCPRCRTSGWSYD